MAIVLLLEHFNYHCFGQAWGPVPTIRLSALTNHSTETEQMVGLQYNTITPEMRNIHSFPSPLLPLPSHLSLLNLAIVSSIRARWAVLTGLPGGLGSPQSMPKRALNAALIRE